MFLQTTNPEITIRSYQPQDIEALVAIANNRNIWLNLTDIFPHPYGIKDAEKFIEMCLNQTPTTVFGIEYRGELAGSIGLHLKNDVYKKSAELGYFVGEHYWNNKIASVAVHRILQYGFETLHLQRIFASVFEHNLASMRVLEKNGFLLEGIKKQAVFKNETFLDEYIYGNINEQ